jgi:hypothetical protein
MLTANTAEVEINERNLSRFAQAMAEGVNPVLQLVDRLPDLDDFTVTCQIRSVWRVEPRRAFISLSFQYDSEYEFRQIKTYVAGLLYPGRHEGNEEQSRKDSSRIFPI